MCTAGTACHTKRGTRCAIVLRGVTRLHRTQRQRCCCCAIVSGLAALNKRKDLRVGSVAHKIVAREEISIWRLVVFLIGHRTSRRYREPRCDDGGASVRQWFQALRRVPGLYEEELSEPHDAFLHQPSGHTQSSRGSGRSQSASCRIASPPPGLLCLPQSAQYISADCPGTQDPPRLAQRVGAGLVMPGPPGAHLGLADRRSCVSASAQSLPGAAAALLSRNRQRRRIRPLV